MYDIQYMIHVTRYIIHDIQYTTRYIDTTIIEIKLNDISYEPQQQ